MTDAQMLEALVDYAFEHDFKTRNFAWIPEDKQALLDYWFTADNYKAVIFDHEFARALFGEYPTYMHTGFKRFAKSTTLVASKLDPRIPAYEAIEDKDFTTGAMTYKAYEYHIHLAVISDNPIKTMYEAVFHD